MLRIIFLVAIVLVISGGAFYFTNLPIEQETALEETVMEKDETTIMMAETEPSGDAMKKEIDENMMKNIMEKTYQYSGQLADVTNGQTIQNINTGGTSSGVAQADYQEGQYALLATFEGLPDPQGTDFYEGWIVRKGDAFDVISTGKVEKIDSVYTNMYSSGQDLTDHSFYVLTIEPDDGDPAPAGHVLEGTLVTQI